MTEFIKRLLCRMGFHRYVEVPPHPEGYNIWVGECTRCQHRHSPNPFH